MAQPSKSLEYFYIICAIAGAISTWYFNIQFIIDHGGFSLITFLQEMFATNGASSFSSDFIVVGLVFLVWSFREAKRLEIRKWWLFFVVTFGVALAFTMPLFMLIRERRIAALANKNI
tara:strand:+ start:1010 stop:1363 length:354 start_codon:yes stop_codon:yes gene_type:complete